MKKFLDDNFLLRSKTAEKLYHDFARKMPIIDYHCHLPQDQIADNKKFRNLTEAWLYGDHYKWRAMRTNGIEEGYCTGDQPDEAKFAKWAETVPYTMRNPLYHWTHLELQRYFDVEEVLNPSSSKKIYDHCSALLQTDEYSVRSLLKKMDVRIICTTDDPIDDLKYHQQLKEENFEIKILPAFRPDKAMQVDDVSVWNTYINKLEAVSGTSVSKLNEFLDALKKRHDFFAANGCGVSDHGLEKLHAADYTEAEIENIFAKARSGKALTATENEQFKSAMLVYFAHWDHEKGWVQQYHVGALRNNNTRRLKDLGPDTGWDSIGDFPQASAMSKFLNKLDNTNQLAKTILYNLNPADNAMVATMTGNFNDGTFAGKVQFGSGWWFLDQKHGMTEQMNALSNMGLISRFVGMLTDSRSFLSYPRHEYFRRLLCDLFGEEIENGELPNDLPWIGKLVEDICYNNAKNYFNW
ncbi:MAG: glucuronate isomerase [Chitinophagaceae bacterium]|nr:MAG: glucuronate isomerase [Chitinophagaceae bacterium]